MPIAFKYKSNVLTLSQNKPWFLRVCRTSYLKTLQEKKKLLVTSNLSFSHSVFYQFGGLLAIFIEFQTAIFKLLQFRRVNNLLFGKELNNEQEESILTECFCW